MKCLIIEKLSDGRIRALAYINADGSATETIYKDAQEAALALPVLDKSATDTSKNPDRAIFMINPDDGSVISSYFQVFSTNKDDPGESSFNIQEVCKAKVLDLANDILVKEGKPALGDSVSDTTTDPINP